METKPNIIRVIAAVVDTTQLTLYKDDGATVAIPQGDPRLAVIVAQITPALAGAPPGTVVEVDIASNEPGQIENPYKEFEGLFGKAIRFFQVARPMLVALLDQALTPKVVAPAVIGQLPQAPPTQPDQAPEDGEDQASKMLKATAEIIKNAKPSHDPSFNDKDPDSTVVAVVGNRVIEDVQKLKPQIAHAVVSGSATGVQAFMERAARVADKRRHSVQDLVKFLEHGDLPIADDGCIIIYKRLYSVAGADYFVDPHTRLVMQKIGDYVCMDPSLVDHNRRIECSNGLHAGRRRYMGQFNGDVIVLCKVHPEDVIAVPDYDANKMRVCGYHLLFRLPQDAFNLVIQNKPFTQDSEGQILLGRALSGDHSPPIQEVRITKSHGQGLEFTPLLKGELVKNAVEVKPAKALRTEDDPENMAPAVDPRKVAQSVSETKAEFESRGAKARRLYDEFRSAKGQEAKTAAAKNLMDHKKSVKLGWAALGLNEDEVSKVQSYLG